MGEQWNKPTLTHYYLMQIAAEVRRVLSKKPNAIKLKDFLIEFITPTKKDKPSKEEKISRTKSMFKAAFGVGGKDSKVKVTHNTRPRSSVDPELRKYLDG